MPTRREQLRDLLTGAAYTPRDLAREVGMRTRDVLDDLEHLRRSLRRAFVVTPAVCQRCDHVFRTRSRLNTPSRCPRCRHERIDGPWIEVRRDDAG